MYVAVKGGESAIQKSYERLNEQRRGQKHIAELNVQQIQEQLKLAVDRVMTEGSLYDPELAALAIKQSSGDLVEAIFLLRAYRTTLPRFGSTLPLETANMRLDRRISATFKDLPGGQMLGPTFDYTQRLLDFSLLASQEGPTTDELATPSQQPPSSQEVVHFPRVVDLLNDEALIEKSQPLQDAEPPVDLTR